MCQNQGRGFAGSRFKEGMSLEWTYNTALDVTFDDPMYLQARRERDNLAAQAMTPAPQHALPFWAAGTKNVLVTETDSCDPQPVRRTTRRFKDGTVETYENDGTVITKYLDGRVVTRHPCGKEETTLDESTIDGDDSGLRHMTSTQRDRNLMKFTSSAISNREKRLRIANGRRAGLSLPSNKARRLAEASRDEGGEEFDRPDVLMFGGHNVLPEMQKELPGMARKCEMNMRIGSNHLLHDERGLETPAYLKHFAGTSLANDWAAPELDIEEEEREWRSEYYAERRNPDRLSDRESLLQEFKFRKRFKRTEVEDEVWRSEKSKRDDAYSARLQQLNADLAEEKARAAKHAAKLRSRDERLAREKKEAEAALQKLEEEEDVENRVYPDAVPAFLMDRPQFFFYKSKLGSKRAVLSEAQQVVVVAPRPAGCGCGGKVEPESEDEEIAIVDIGPDTADVK